MNAVEISAGKRFGRFVVVKEIERSKSGDRRVRCQCDCGRETTIRAYRLRGGEARFCRGCPHPWLKTHGDTAGRANLPTPEYRAWQQMKQRCLNPKHRAFKDYGGRGIRVCDEWRDSFAAFLRDTGRRPSLQHSLDRIDNNKGYAPGNVRWATMKVQSNNRRRPPTFVVFSTGETISQVATRLGLGSQAIHKRRRLGWTEDQILNTLPRQSV